jgi:hypothetical protein
MDAWSEVRRVSQAIFLVALFALVAIARPAFAAMPAGSASYSGKTSERLGVKLRIASDGQYVARMHIRYRVTCSDGARGAPTTDLFDLHIDGHGRFGFNGTYTGRVDKSKNRVRMHGRVSSRRATGTFTLKAKRKKVRCHSANVRWHARLAS